MTFNRTYYIILLCFCQTIFAQEEITYLFEGDLHATTSEAPSLIPLGEKGVFRKEQLPELNNVYKSVYCFDKNSGLQFDNNASNNFLNDVYSIELYFKFNTLNSWKRVIDFKGRTMDQGAYIYNGKLNFYTVVVSEFAPVRANEYTHYIITRDSNKTVTIYADGISKVTFNDTNDLAVLNSDNVLRFFQDDLIVGNEASAGSVAYIKLYSDVINAQKALNQFQNFKTLLTSKTTKNSEVELNDHSYLNEKITIKIIDKESGEIIPATFHVNNQLIETTNGSVDYKLRNHVDSLWIVIKAKDYLMIDTVISKIDTNHIELPISKLKKGLKFKLNEIKFEKSKAEILPESKKALDKLLAFMISNKHIHIEIGGHTDNIGDPILNMRLSKERAALVKEFLIENGIDKKRVSSKGYGGFNPLIQGGNEKDHEANRRVECTITRL